MKLTAERFHLARARTAPPAEVGFTLVELLIVMSLIAVLMGLGIGVFANFKTGDRIATSLVQTVVRSAHNWAVSRLAPARVVVDPAANALHAEGLQVVGTWHFEGEPIKGAFGIDGVRLGGHFVEDGFQGQALSFEGEPARSRVDFAVQQDSSWNFAHGFALRCAVRPASARGGVLLEIGGVIGVETTDDGALKAWFIAQRTDDDQKHAGTAQQRTGDERKSGRGGRVTIATDPRLLAPQHWTMVELTYDRRAFTVRIDGQVAAFVAETAPVSLVEGPLALSPSQNAFPGAIDSLVVSAVVADERSELPKGVVFAQNTPVEILFQPGGGLDRERHREPIRLELEFEDGHKETVGVNLYGTVE